MVALHSWEVSYGEASEAAGPGFYTHLLPPSMGQHNSDVVFHEAIVKRRGNRNQEQKQVRRRDACVRRYAIVVVVPITPRNGKQHTSTNLQHTRKGNKRGKGGVLG